MNVRADITLDTSSPAVHDRTGELLIKAHAILDLLRCASEVSASLETVSAAAWAAQDMIEDANKLNGWF